MFLFICSFIFKHILSYPTSQLLLNILTGPRSDQLALCNGPALPSNHLTLVQEKVGRDPVKIEMCGGIKNQTCSTKTETGQIVCTIHQKVMILKTDRVRKWKLGRNGLYRNVFETVKTWKCPTIIPDVVTKPRNFSQGEITNLNPAKMFKIFEKRKRT